MRPIEGSSITIAGMVGIILTLGPLVAVLGRGVSAQDRRESQNEASIDTATLKGPHPLSGLMKTLKEELKPHLPDEHPKNNVTAKELQSLPAKSQSSSKRR